MKYNTLGYNEQRYNINGVFHVSALSETMTESDATQLADLIKTISESISAADATLLFAADQFLVDFIFLDAAVQIQFTNKAINDTVRLSDWLSIERNPVNNEWYD